MRKNIICLLGLLSCLLLQYACTPDKYTFVENNLTDPATIGKIKLYPNSNLLLADGKAEIELHPVLYNQEGFQIPNDRVNDEWLEYYTLSGEKLSRYYTTAKRELIGQEVEVYARLKGRDICSDTVHFQIAEPLKSDELKELILPVVFHIIQSETEITSYGGELPARKISSVLEKLNRTFSGMISRNPVGVDTRIRFCPALYDPSGQKLQEAGIHRVILKQVEDIGHDQYNTFVLQNKILWPCNRYFNIWIISDTKGAYTNFCYDISSKCFPRYVKNSATEPMVQGLSFSVVPQDWDPEPLEVGLMYKLQSLNKMQWVLGTKNETELMNCLGTYLGLLPTWVMGSGKTAEDYCNDTQFYYVTDDNNYNKGCYKTAGECYFLSENIMDDQTGMHRSVSAEQSLRMRWVLENCPERSAWRSEFAFTGLKD